MFNKDKYLSDKNLLTNGILFLLDYSKLLAQTVNALVRSCILCGKQRSTMNAKYYYRTLYHPTTTL